MRAGLEDCFLLVSQINDTEAHQVFRALALFFFFLGAFSRVWYTLAGDPVHILYMHSYASKHAHLCEYLHSFMCSWHLINNV